jgi:hypothetical protein
MSPAPCPGSAGGGPPPAAIDCVRFFTAESGSPLSLMFNQDWATTENRMCEKAEAGIHRGFGGRPAHGAEADAAGGLENWRFGRNLGLTAYIIYTADRKEGGGASLVATQPGAC